MTDPDDYPVLYHYCSATSLLGILNTRSLWMTHISSLNDRYEVQWFLSLVRDSFFRQPGVTESATKSLESEIRAGIANHEAYVACLSGQPSAIPQWMAYGDNGSGVCIGFSRKIIAAGHGFPDRPSRTADPEDVVKVIESGDENEMERLAASPLIARVSYDEATARDCADRLVCAMLSQRPKDWKGGWAFELAFLLAMFFKKAEFAYEDEFRLIFSNGTSQLDCTTRALRPTQYGIAPYHPYKFSTDSVVQILLGPKNPTGSVLLKRHLKGKVADTCDIQKVDLGIR